jgi:ribosomal protein S27AE
MMPGLKMELSNMPKWKAKSCPRCGGDIFLDIDEHSWIDHCLQCGYVRTRSGEPCPLCHEEMVYEADGYKCIQCGHTSKAPVRKEVW